jgi:hypothetical protein
MVAAILGDRLDLDAVAAVIRDDNHRSVLPERLEATRREVGVPHRVLDISVSKVMLDRACVVAVVRELVAACMAKHVRMNWEAESRYAASTRNDLPHRRGRERSSSLVAKT